MMRRLVSALLASALLGAFAAPARAQEEAPPPLTVDVESIHVPASLGKLVSTGVRVTASCSADCILVVKVRLPASVAAKLGLNKTVIGTGVGDATAGELRTVRAKISQRAADSLRGYHGSKGLQVRVTALP
jgi:hypothetical protein